MANSFIIFTDGSSRGNPGPGGWGAVLVKDGSEVDELGGSEKKTTNNRMELRAAIEALKKVPTNADAVIYTDSSYLINGITKWIKGWKAIGWITRTKEEVLNRDLWTELDSLVKDKRLKWEYVGSHVGIAGNERCDEIATSFADGKKVELFNGLLSKYAIKKILEINRSTLKSETKSRRTATAYSYISMIKGAIMIHHSWAECEKRVKGIKSARYRKALNAEDEENIIKEFRNM